MRLSRRSQWLLRIAVAVGLAFIYIPLLVIGIYAFNSSKILEWPPPGFTTHWFSQAFKDEAAREAFFTSLKAGVVAAAIALVLGTLAALAVARHRFFGRETISFLVILPIALPGIVTGVAISNTFTQVLDVPLSLFTVIVGHATFCIVVVYNNAVARLRRLSGSFEEASADLGAHSWQTFRYVTFPGMKSALIAGGLLAFALSFDEIIVTNFTIGAGEQTLPIWIYSNLFRPHELPIVNAVAVIVILISIIPVYLAHRLGGDEGGPTAGRGAGGEHRPRGHRSPVTKPFAVPFSRGYPSKEQVNEDEALAPLRLFFSCHGRLRNRRFRARRKRAISAMARSGSSRSSSHPMRGTRYPPGQDLVALGIAFLRHRVVVKPRHRFPRPRAAAARGNPPRRLSQRFAASRWSPGSAASYG